MSLGKAFGFLVVFLVQMSFGSDNPDILRYVDPNIDPCENFYEYSCGDFKNQHPRPPNTTLIDQFSLLEANLKATLKQILEMPNEETDPTALRKVRAAYKACINTHFSDHLQWPETSIIQEVGGLPLVDPSAKDSSFGWTQIGHLAGQYGVPILFNFDIMTDPFNSSQNLIYISLESKISQHPDMIKDQPESYEEIIEESLSKITNTRTKTKTKNKKTDPFMDFLWKLAQRISVLYPVGPDYVKKNLDDVIGFIAEVNNGGIIDGDVPKISENVYFTVAELQKWTEDQFQSKINIDWLEYLNQVFQISSITITPETKIMNANNMHQLFYGILNLTNRTNPDIIKNFSLLRIFLYMAPDSDSATYQLVKDYYASIDQPIYDRSEYCIRKLSDVYGTASTSFAIAYAYQRYFYDVNKLDRAKALVLNLNATFREIIESSDWMDADSKSRAANKLDYMIYLLGYPEIAENGDLLDSFYGNVRVCTWDHYGNSKRIRALKQALDLSSLDANVRKLWNISPFTVNAYYTRSSNRIIIPIAMLNEVFFTGMDLVDYSRIGTIIGHEMTHGFDQNGMRYNEFGNYDKWWSDITYNNFLDRTICFQEQYSRYYVNETHSYVNGSNTLAENLADNGGLLEAYKAFKKLQTESRMELDRLFFIGFATNWCSNESEEYLEYAATKGYAPAKWRVNGAVSNSEDFAKAFRCPLGSKMNPVVKCKLW